MIRGRAAIKQFDPARKIEAEQLDALIEAANLTPTSGGLQPFKIVVVSSDEYKEKLAPHTMGQPQVVTASHTLIFAVETNLDGSLVDRYIDRAAEVRGKSKESLIGYADSMRAYIESMDEKAKYNWSKHQAYIALGTVMTVAAALRIDTCPMEGFNPAEFQRILNLQEKHLMPVVILPVGYRSDEDRHSKAKKVRKTISDFVLTAWNVI